MSDALQPAAAVVDSVRDLPGEVPVVLLEDVETPVHALSAAFARLLAGDLDSLETIYDAYADQLFGLAFWRTRSPDDAADAVQEVFVTLARAPSRLARVRDPRAYLLAMAHSAALRIVRRRRTTVEVDDAVMGHVSLDPGVGVDAARVAAVMRRLSPRQCEAVYLRHYADLTFAQIGKVTGVPTFTAASRYRLGVARLRKLLGVTP